MPSTSSLIKTTLLLCQIYFFRTSLFHLTNVRLIDSHHHNWHYNWKNEMGIHTFFHYFMEASCLLSYCSLDVELEWMGQNEGILDFAGG